MEFHFYGSFNKNANYYYKYKEKCIFHGHIPHETMLKEFASSDIIIFPSFADGFGFSVTEAILRNNIAICSNNAGVSELIKNGENGFVYAPNDTEKLVDILNNIDKMELKKMQMNSPKTLINYTWDNYNNHVKAAIEKILE